MGKFVIRTVPTGIKFDLKAPNGETILTSEVYATEESCRKGILSIQKNASFAKLENQTEENFRSCTNPKFEMYTDKSGFFRFRLKARNGAVIAMSESYASKSGCLHGIESVRRNAPAAEICFSL